MEKISLISRGRITLIKLLLSNLLVYYLFVFSILIKVANELEQMQRDFLWEGGGSKNDHLLSWNEVCKPKSMGGGGLGIENITLKNKFLLGKWIWRFTLEESSLWHSLILCKYGSNKNEWDSKPNPPSRASVIWKCIFATYPLVYYHLSVIIGNGNRIRSWIDVWIGDSPLFSFPSSFPNCSQQKCLCL